MGGMPTAPVGAMGGFDMGMMGATPPGYHFAPLTCAVPMTLSGSVVHVIVGDMGMTSMLEGVAPVGQHMMLRAVPTQVAAGQISFVVGNVGWRIHELVVLPLGPGQQAGERVPGANGKVAETGSLGEASASCAAGAGDGISAQSVGWTTLTLAPGRYELLCNLPNHYADRMFQEIVVT